MIVILYFLMMRFFAVCEGQHIRIASTQAEIKCFFLPDSSRIYLNSESLLEYPVLSEGSNRFVKARGEIFIESLKSDLDVTIERANVDRIKCRADSRIDIINYKEDEFCQVSIMAGSATIYCGTKKTLLRAGQKLRIFRHKEIIYNDRAISDDTEWVNGRMATCDMCELRTILNSLRRHFKSEIKMINLDKCLDESYHFSYPLKIDDAKSLPPAELSLRMLAKMGHLSFKQVAPNSYVLENKD